jgi:hypothetical protein
LFHGWPAVKNRRVQFNDTKFRLWAWLAALFLVVLGAKFCVIQFYGSSLPFMDQWDEAKLLFLPWLDGHLTWKALFAAHNEHRILFTRLLDLLELQLNGQWDPRLQMVINAFLQAGFACGLAYGLWGFTGRKWAGLICFLLIPFFALPFAAENTIHGFHSAQYLANIFSVAAIVGLGFGTPGKGWWWLGLAAAVMSLFTMASGLLAPLAVAGLVVVRMLKQKEITRNQLITLGCCLAVVVAGLALSVSVAMHKPIQAHSLPEFLKVLAGNLAWPFRIQPLMGYLICLPLFLLGIQYLRAKDSDRRGAEFILVLGVWGFLQVAALSYGRAILYGGSRYMDALAIIPLASLASLFVMGDGEELRRLPRPGLLLLAMAWTCFCIWGIWQIDAANPQDDRVVYYSQWSKHNSLIQEGNVRAFVATDDSRFLLNQPFLHIPHTDGEPLLAMLRNSKLQTIFPAVCRPPLKLTAATNSDATFVLDGYPLEKPKQEFARVWGSYTTNGVAATGHFISEPISARLPKLNIQLCCGPGTNGIHLQLVELPTGRAVELIPQVIGRWHTVIVAAPRNPFRLEITDQSHDSWVAVGEIQEMGRWSAGAQWLLNRAVIILLAGLCLCVVLAARNVLRHGTILGGSAFPEFLILPAALMTLWFVWRAWNFDVTGFDCQFHKQLAAQLVRQHNFTGAELHFREALWRQPDDAETFTNLANAILHDPVLEKKQARAEATADYEAALRLKPDSTEIKNQLRSLRESTAK